MNRTGMLLIGGIDYITNKLHRKRPVSFQEHLKKSNTILVICPPGKLVFENQKQIGHILSLFSNKQLTIVHHNSELQTNENIFDPPLPSVNLNSLSFWEALSTPSLETFQTGGHCDLLIKLDPEDRGIYRFLKRRCKPHFILDVVRHGASSDAHFVFNMTSDQLGPSLEKLTELIESALSDKR